MTPLAGKSGMWLVGLPQKPGDGRQSGRGECTERGTEEQRITDSRLQHDGSGRTGGTGPGQGVLSPELEADSAVMARPREAKRIQAEPVGNEAERAGAR